MKKKTNFDQRLDVALGQPPRYSLPDDFSDRVLQKIALRRQATDKRAGYVLWGATAGFVALATVCFALFLDRESLLKVLDISEWAVLTGVLVAVFQVLDHKLLQRKLPT